MKNNKNDDRKEIVFHLMSFSMLKVLAVSIAIKPEAAQFGVACDKRSLISGGPEHRVSNQCLLCESGRQQPRHHHRRLHC